MKKQHIYLLVSIITATLSSCGTAYYGTFGYSLIGSVKDESTDTASVYNNTYEDSLIKIEWSVNDYIENFFYFKLFNKTGREIMIDWDRVVLLCQNMQLTRAYWDTDTYIPPKSSLNQRIQWRKFTPMVLHSLDKWRYYGYGTYKIIEIAPTYNIEVRNSWKDLLGTKFSVYMPMQINGEFVNYRFLFDTSKLKVLQERPDDYYEVTEGTDFPQDDKGKKR